ncbi:cupin domain-containing protein [Candidatus Chloroploca sp. Khr17]|uniref:cupin domain-containing protein n=1 Tax=Candidatus Chloroploca sp. Khr17 TaxID=2496869 RepID=UPI00101BA53D|nr:cupin domain-containing protein [Candidatus Chloroploca sp. Khr17]
MEQIDHTWQILATGAETGGAFGLVACTLPPFSPGTGRHRHADQLVGYYVIAGIVALTRSEATITLSAGGFTLIRPGEPHRYWNPSPSPAQLLLLFAPGSNADELQRLAGDAPGAGTGAWHTS